MFDNLSEKGKKEVLMRLELECIKEETIHRMKTDPAILEYFNKFRPSSISGFIQIYVMKKEHWLLKGAEFAKHNLNFDLKYRNKATEGLRMILSKKLLIKMCEWSAGIIELEGIETSDDFCYWKEDIFNCPFLDPVTQEEIDIYAKYLKSQDPDEYDNIMFPYTYLLVRRDYEKYEDNGEPEFSILYDTLKGTTDRWLLPNIKCAKEEIYKKAYQEEWTRKYLKDIEDGKIPDPRNEKRPHLDSNDVYIEEFARKFEPPHVLDKFRSTKKFSTDQVHYDDRGNKLPDPYLGNPIDLTMDALKNVFDEYLFRIENGLSFEKDDKKLKEVEDQVLNNKNQIIEGRILLGEPGDLDLY